VREIWRGKAGGYESALRVDESGAVSVWMRCSDGAFHELRDSPFQKASALVQLLREVDTREQSRLARCAAESRRLSLEECCYWLMVIGKSGLAERMVELDADHLTKAVTRYRGELREPRYGKAWRRECALTVFICREALRRIVMAGGVL
jgi:hypothetical protein